MSQIIKKGTVAILLAAGSGTRMGADITKQRMMLGGMTVFSRCLRAFDTAGAVDGIVVVCRQDETELLQKDAENISDKVICFVNGGKNRAESAKNGFLAAEKYADTVVIHDACRCLIEPSDIDKVIEAARKHGAASAVVPVFDTVKRIDPCGYIVSTENRELLRAASTPQVFKCEDYKRALDASPDLELITDDNMLMQSISVPVMTVFVSRSNIKITTPEDLLFAEFILARRSGI